MTATVHSVHREWTLRTPRLTSVCVQPAGVAWIRGTVAWIRGTLDGAIVVQPGGRAIIIGTVTGDVINRGGHVTIWGSVGGQILTDHNGVAVYARNRATANSAVTTRS